LANITVKGRVEIVKTNTPYMVMIDYAHNAMSLKNILTTMRRYHPYRLIVLFGCGGGRAKSRRKEMGRIAGKYADFTVITSDNPRYEKPEAIMQEIRQGIDETEGDYVMITDRKQAIAWLLKQAQPGDILILAGKGHEIYQEKAGEKIEFDERKIVKEILRTMK
jgi:UDP-N-acetylmuramoyl-L-alanyl-D-glutamate--2,6-diaminopimelate ligase